MMIKYKYDDKIRYKYDNKIQVR